jgi:hypothetical protein
MSPKYDKESCDAKSIAMRAAIAKGSRPRL